MSTITQLKDDEGFADGLDARDVAFSQTFPEGHPGREVGEYTRQKGEEARAFVAEALMSWSPKSIVDSYEKTLPRDRGVLLEKARDACLVFLTSDDNQTAFSGSGEHFIYFPGGSFKSGSTTDADGRYVHLTLEKSVGTVEISFYETTDESGKGGSRKQIKYHENAPEHKYLDPEAYVKGTSETLHANVELQIHRLEQGEHFLNRAEFLLLDGMSDVYEKAKEALRAEGVVGYIAPIGFFLDNGLSGAELTEMKRNGKYLDDSRELRQQAGIIVSDGSWNVHLFGYDRASQKFTRNTELEAKGYLSGVRGQTGYPLGLDNCGNICTVGEFGRNVWSGGKDSSPTHLYIWDYYSPASRLLTGNQVSEDVAVTALIKSLDTTEVSDRRGSGGTGRSTLELEDYLDMRARIFVKLASLFKLEEGFEG